MDLLLIVFLLLAASVGLFAYQFSKQKLIDEVHLPSDLNSGAEQKRVTFKDILNLSAQFTDRLIEKTNMPLEHLKKKLISAGRPMNVSQFFAFKVLTMVALPFIAFILFHNEPILFILPIVIGYIIPDLWLNNTIKKRQTLVLRDLPHIIDLLNICVGAGLDFMLAVTRVTEEFRPCVLVDEFKGMLHEIQMGSPRREALKNFGGRINSTEVLSFVRTLLQADRMGTPIAEALKMQAEELRFRRFQRGEEMGLKAPIKLLFPLLFFILPVVLIIVAGPILIEFTRGGFMKF
jgi:tight adherence protein C